MYTHRIEQAIRAAAWLHRDHERIGDPPLPYITHLYGVAMHVSDYTDDEDTIIAALLHDTVEDVGYTFEEMTEDFGETVKEIVSYVTEDSHDEDTGKKLPWRARKQTYIDRLKIAPAESLLVAAADKMYNFRSWIEDYHDDPTGFMKAFGGDIRERRDVYGEMMEIITSRLDGEVVEELINVWGLFDEFLTFVAESTEEANAEV